MAAPWQVRENAGEGTATFLWCEAHKFPVRSSGACELSVPAARAA